jgi:hypothetical protein
MNVEAPRRDLAAPFLSRLSGFWRPLRNLGAARSLVNEPRSLLTAAEFQEELAILGLSGRRFDGATIKHSVAEHGYRITHRASRVIKPGHKAKRMRACE